MIPPDKSGKGAGLCMGQLREDTALINTFIVLAAVHGLLVLPVGVRGRAFTLVIVVIVACFTSIPHPPFSSPLISLVVSVDVEHHVYLLHLHTQEQRQKTEPKHPKHVTPVLLQLRTRRNSTKIM